MPFNIYTDFESLLKGIQGSDKNNASYTEKYHDHISCSFACKVVCTDDNFSKRSILLRKKIRFINSLKEYLKSMIIVKN